MMTRTFLIIYLQITLSYDKRGLSKIKILNKKNFHKTQEYLFKII